MGSPLYYITLTLEFFSSTTEWTTYLRVANSPFVRCSLARQESSSALHTSLHRLPSGVQDLHGRHVRVGTDNQGKYSGDLNTVTIWIPVSEYWTSLVFKWSKVVRFANGPVFKWLGCVIIILMLRNYHSYVLPFEYRTLKSPVFRWILYSGVWYSDGYCTDI